MRAFILALLICGGCASVAPTNEPAPRPTTSEERMLDRSYTIGKEETAFVGANIARVKDYIVLKTTRQGALHASNDFCVFYPPIGPRDCTRSDEPIRIVGTTERDGKTYRLVSFHNQFVKLLLNDDGTLEGSALGLGNSRMGWNYSPTPPGVVLRPDTSSSSISSQGYLNFELVYSGVTKDSIRLHYREFTQGDLVRPAFSQDVVYDRDSQTIRFRSLVIKVIEAGPERIRYVVAEDGYPAGGFTK